MELHEVDLPGIEPGRFIRYKKGETRKEYLRFVARGVGLETHPRDQWDLFINISVCMYKMFQGI